MLTIKYYPSLAQGHYDVVIAKDPAVFDGDFRRLILPEISLQRTSTLLYALAMDFHIPTDATIDIALYNITDVKLWIYSRASALSPTYTQNNVVAILRNETALDDPILQYRNNEPTLSAIYNVSGVNYCSGGSFTSVPGAYRSIQFTNAFHPEFFTYQSYGYIGILLRIDSVSASQFVDIYTSQYQTGDNAPYLEITYELKQEPGVITTFALNDPNTTTYVEAVGTTITLKDTESDAQTLEIEVRAQIGSVFAPWANMIFTPAGTLLSDTVGIVHSPIAIVLLRKNSLANTFNFTYHQTPNLVSATYNGTDVDISSAGYISDTLNANVDLKENTIYRFSGTGGILQYEVFINGVPEPFITTTAYDPADSSTYITFNSGINPDTVSLIVRNNQGSLQTLQSVILTEDVFPTVGWLTELRARITDNDGTTAWFNLPQQITMDGRAPELPILTDDAGGTSEVYQTNSDIDLTWDEVAVEGGGVLNGYRWVWDVNANTVPTNVAPLIPALGSGGRIEQTMPFDNRWYFHVAGESAAGLIGETAHYGMFYNIPAEFNNENGIIVNDITLFTDRTEWISHDFKPIFTWEPTEQPQNIINYNIQVGTDGGIDTFLFSTWDIYWDDIPAGKDIYFKLLVQDMIGLIYLNKESWKDNTGFEIYNVKTGWTTLAEVIALDLVSESTLLTHVRYTTTSSDELPDGIPLYLTIAVGYWDAVIGDFIWFEQSQMKNITFDPDPTATGFILSDSVVIPTAEYLTYLIQISKDSFVDDITTFTPGEFLRSFVYVRKHDKFTKLATYFKSGSELANDTNTSVGTAQGTASLVYVPGRLPTLQAIQLDGIDQRIDFEDNYDVDDENFSVSCWINLTSNSTFRTIIGKRLRAPPSRGWSIRINTFDQVEVYLGNGTTSAQYTVIMTLSDSLWHHVVFTINRAASEVKIYIDNVLIQTDSLTITGDYGNTENLYIGAIGTGTDENYEDMLDDVLLFGRVISPDEVNVLYRHNFETKVIGPEEAISTLGFFGANKEETFKVYGRNELNLVAGVYDWRLKRNINGVQDPSYTLSLSGITLAVQAVPAYTWVFTLPEIDEDNLVVPNFKPVTPLTLTGTTYYVRVRPHDGFQYGTWSERYKFRINALPLPPTNLFIQ